MKYFKIRIICLFLVTLSIFISAFVSNKWVLAFLTVISSTFLVYIDQIIDYSKKRKIRIENRNKIVNVLKNFSDYIQSYTKYNFDIQKLSDEILREEIEITPENVYRISIEHLFEEFDESKKKIIFIMSLCYHIEQEKDLIKSSRIRKIISDLIENYNLTRLDNESKKLLNSYYNFKSSNLLFRENKNLDFSKLTLEFTHDFCRIQNFAKILFEEKNQIEEFYKTLSYMIQTGKLNTLLIEKRIRRKIKNYQSKSKSYILLMNKFQKLPQVKNSLDKFPQLEIGRLKPKKFPKETRYLHMRILYPETDYPTTEKFLEKEIIEKIPEDERKNGFVALIPIEGSDAILYPELKEKLSNENLRKSFASITHIKTGVPLDISDVIIDSIKSDISLPQILSVLPFNIFVPGINEKSKIFLIKNYEKIRKKFGIETLFDWHTINSKDLASTIKSIKGSNILKENEWDRIAVKICLEAKNHTNAAFNIREK